MHNVADVIDRQIKKMDLGDRVVVGLLCAYGHSDNMKRLDITMSRKEAPRKSRRQPRKADPGHRSCVASGELIWPIPTCWAFSKTEAFLLNCQNNPAQFILITDGVESSRGRWGTQSSKARPSTSSAHHLSPVAI